MNVFRILSMLLTADTTSSAESVTVSETLATVVTEVADATDAIPTADGGGKGIMFYIIAGITVVAVMALLIIISKLVSIIIYNKRVALRKKLIAMENNNDIRTVVLDVLSESEDRIEAAGAQVLGTRQNQQDCYYVSSQFETFDLLKNAYVVGSVCDGMGGLSSGEVASKITVDCIEAGFRSFLNGKDSQKDIKTLLKEITIMANEKVCQYGIDNGEANKCGTTMTCAFMENNNLYWASVGDSRIYIIRGAQIMQITNDHNYGYILKQKVEQGEISLEEANTDPKREALISYIGKTDLDLMDLSINPIKLKKGDVVLLCSDGITKILNDTQIHDAVIGHMGTTQELASYLTMLATDMCTGSQDNTTVVVITYK